MIINNIELSSNFNLNENELVLRRAMLENEGGLGPLGLASLIETISNINPDVYIEIGAWKGITCAVVEDIFKNKIKVYVAFEPNINLVKENLPSSYNLGLADFATPSYTSCDVIKNVYDNNSFAFVDDHQDVAERIATLYLRGVDYALFDDDYLTRADHRTFSNSLMKTSEGMDYLEKFVEEINFFNIESNHIKILANKLNEKYPGFDFKSGFRNQVLVKLKKPFAPGWSMGVSPLKIKNNI